MPKKNVSRDGEPGKGKPAGKAETKAIRQTEKDINAANENPPKDIVGR